MLSKEMLGGDSKSRAYTHIISVGGASNQYGYSSGNMASYSQQMGAIDPEYIGETYSFPIEILYTRLSPSTQTIISNDSASDIQQGFLYLARCDTGINYGLCNYGRYDYEFIWNFQVFTSNDVGKQIPIWLSTTPPLGLRAVIKQPSILRRLHNAWKRINKCKASISRAILLLIGRTAHRRLYKQLINNISSGKYNIWSNYCQTLRRNLDSFSRRSFIIPICRHNCRRIHRVIVKKLWDRYKIQICKIWFSRFDYTDTGSSVTNKLGGCYA